ncbi:MAG: hypothetical protein JWP27_468 [Flaviaesturariibacter sp.]|nr:hypothetical protein [Flaviaesturariibacter sp.]
MTLLAHFIISVVPSWLQWTACLLLAGGFLYMLTATERPRKHASREEARQLPETNRSVEDGERDQRVG